MRIGMDVHFAVNMPRTGLFYHHYHLLTELQRLVDEPIRLFIAADGSQLGRADAARISGQFCGARVHLYRTPSWMWRIRTRLSALGRLDVFYHVWWGLFDPVRTAANVYLIPDIIPLKVDYCDPWLVDVSRRYYEKASQSGDVILVYSEHTKADLVATVGTPPEKVQVAPLAAGPEFRPISDRPAVAARLAPFKLDGTPYVLCASTLERRKNHVLLLRAFARLKALEPGLPHKLVLVGTRWKDQDAVVQTAEQLGLGDTVCYLGYADGLEYLYNGADLFVFPSLYEGFGLPPLEAMACGVPVIVTDCTSLPEVVGDAGLLVDGYEEGPLCEAMRRVLTDPVFRRDLAARSLRRAAAFSWQRTAQAYLGAFHRAREIQQGGRPPQVAAVPATG
jgi:glycosyltransferase involved in cell wall biosynthesis